MTIKVDMAKAYNRIEWDILISILKAHGFSEDMGKQVYGYVSLVYYSVLTNGSPYEFFARSRGVHQGDPMSPPLFIITTNLLSRILARAETQGRINGVKISRTSSRITHLMYADDLLIYCKTDKNEVIAVKECLDLYCKWTGQRID